MPVDLHLHSTASDGSESPTRVVEMAVDAGLAAIALTDHDIQDGIAEARRRAGSELEVVPGVELSIAYDTGGMHMVVLWLEPGPGPLQDRLEWLRQGRDRRNQEIVARLGELGMPVVLDEVLAEAKGGSVGRPHIAAVMVRHGYVAGHEEAFDLWLAQGRPAYIPRPRLSQEEAIGLALESGAVPVLAHPHTLLIDRAEEMADLLRTLAGYGLVGLESVYSGYFPHERDGYTDLARRFGLVPSGGSDYHGLYKPGLEVGTGYGDLVIPDRVLEELRLKAGK